MYRFKEERLELFLVHPGGPLWAGKDEGAWSIPKGEYLPGEEPLVVARREFLEETGLVAEGEFLELSEIRQPGGKRVKAWAFAGDCDPSAITSNTFPLEWPPRSGRFSEFPEVDRAGWFELGAAKAKILKGQLPLIEELCLLIHS